MSALTVVSMRAGTSGPAPAELAAQAKSEAGETVCGLWLYRDRTVGLLRRYLRLSIEVGRMPSLLGREFFRTRVTSYRTSTFEDTVIFVHDVERSLELLDGFERRLLAKIVLQEYSQEEAGRLLGCGLRTVSRRYAETLDRVSEIFLEREILARLPESRPQSTGCCQESKSKRRAASNSEQTRNNGNNILDTHEQTSYTLTMKSPRTLQEAIIYFADPQQAFDSAVKLRWPDGKVTCPRCSSEKHSFIKTRRIWFCYGCQKQFTLKVGTVFEDSALGLDKWMTAVWMLVNCKNGVSSWELHRTLGVTQKSAWFMLQRIRLALQEKSIVKLGGPGSEIEVDETFIGGKARFMHKDRRIKTKLREGNWGKAIVMGMLERDGKVGTRVIADRKKEALHSVLDEMVDKVRSFTPMSTPDIWAWIESLPIRS